MKQPCPSGSELHGPLRGYYKIKLRKAGYRLVYRVDEAKRKLVVTAVGRRDAEAVRSAVLRSGGSAAQGARDKAPVQDRRSARRRTVVVAFVLDASVAIAWGPPVESRAPPGRRQTGISRDSMLPAAPEPTLGAQARFEGLDRLKNRLHHRNDDKLRQPLHRLELERFLPTIPTAHHQRSLVIGID